VRLRCPKCSAEYNYIPDLNKGTHHERHCACGAKLQADLSMKSQSLAGGGFSIEIGPPEPCIHQDLRDPAALTPLRV
jgi:hypothetical protein